MVHASPPVGQRGDALPVIHPPPWMNERRQRVAARFVRFLHTHSGKLYLSDESVVRLCRDAALLPHELDRAIDDLFGLGAIEVSAPDDLAHVVKLLVPPSRLAWRVPGLAQH